MNNPTDYNTKSKQAPITIIGAGTLGSRIALMMLTQGNEVRLCDKNKESLQKAIAFVEENIASVLPTIAKGKKGELKGYEKLEEAVKGAWLIIEAIPEIKEAKIELLGQIDKYADEAAIITTNSSSYKSSTLAEKVKHKNRLLNTHFMMPPQSKVVELMTSGETDAPIIEFLNTRLKDYGLSPYVVQKESMGFIYNRIWAAVKREALYVLAEGAATPETIDAIFKEVTGAKYGICRMMDQVGLDVVLDIEEHYAENRKGLPEEPRQLLRKMISENKLGVKTGEGFYKDYTK